MNLRPLRKALFCAAAGWTALAMAEPATTQPAEIDASMQSYRAHIAAAHAALKLDDPAAAREWLGSAPGQHRGFEYRLLAASVDHSTGIVAECASAVRQIALSPDGKFIAVATARGTVDVFAQDGQRVHELNTGGDVYRVAFSPDGQQLAAAGADRTVRVWHTATGELHLELKGFRTPVTGVAFSNDGKTLYACNYTPLDQPPGVDGTVKRWSLETGEELPELRGGGVKPLSGIALSPDGSQIAAGSWDGELWIWKLDGGATRVIKLPDDGPYNAVNAIAWSPDGKWLACGGKDNTARVFTADTGALQHTLRHDGWVNTLAFTSDSMQLITGCADEQARTWRVSDGSILKTLRGGTGAVTALGVVPDRSELITAGGDGKLLRFRLDVPADVLTWDGPRGCYGLSFTPDGTQLIVNGFDGTLRRYDAFSGMQMQSERAHAKSSNWSSLSADGSRVVTCSWDKSLRLFDAASLAHRLTIDLGETAAYGCAISSDGTRVAAAMNDGTARVYDTSEGALVHDLRGHTKGLHEVAFSRDGSLLASGATDYTARVWSMADGACIATLEGHRGSVEAVALLPDSRHIVTAAGDGEAALWNIAEGKSVWRRKVSPRGLQRAAVSPDGRRIAIAGDALYLLDADTGATVLRTRPREGDIYNLTFSPDGQRLAMCSADGWIAILDTRPVRARLPVSTTRPSNGDRP